MSGCSQRDGATLIRPKSVAITSIVLTTSVLPTKTCDVLRPVKELIVRFGPGGTIHMVGDPPLT